MRVPWEWSRTAFAVVERFPLLGWLQSGTRKGLLMGATLGGLALLLVGGIFGEINHQAVGALIGALSGLLGGVALGGIIGAIVGPRYLPQEGRATLSIELENSGARYTPGESVSGYVQLRAEDTLRIHSVKVYFVCRGFYAYDQIPDDGSDAPVFHRDTRQYLVQQADLMSTTIIRLGSVHRRAFGFSIPAEALPTYHGYICALRWSLHAVLDAPDIPTIEAHQELLIDATAPAVPVLPAGYQSIAPSPVCQLSLVLPRVTFAEGESIEVRAHITPIETFLADEVRAVLLRIENTAGGDDHTVYVRRWDIESGLFQGERHPGGRGTTYVWLEGERVLASPFRFSIAEPVTIPFSLGVPAQWRPTLQTKDGRVTWKVGVIISRGGHSDVRAFHEVVIYTGTPDIMETLEAREAQEREGGPRSWRKG
jgi:hypothetical protein